MSNAKIRFDERAVALALSGYAWESIRRYAYATAAQMKRNVGEPWGGVPSAPGAFPKKRTGNLQRSITVVEHPKQLRCDIVVGAPYAEYLEKGTDRMAARPFIVRTWNQMSRLGIRATLTTPAPRTVTKVGPGVKLVKNIRRLAASLFA